MRGDDEQTERMFSYLSPEARVPADHPLRALRRMTDAIFDRLSPQFDRVYSKMGRPSIPPEKLLRALLLQGLYTVRSERLLIEQLDYNLLFRWFVGLGIDDPVWHPTAFTTNRDRLARGRGRGQVPGGGAQPRAGSTAAEPRALLGRRHADRGVGVDEDLRAEGRERRPATAGRHRQGRQDAQQEARP